MSNQVIIKDLGCVDYRETFDHMLDFTVNRDESTGDQIWLLEHPPVFTQGQAGKQEHLLAPGDIPVEKVDRGGQVTYHGPGQLVAYLLLDIKRKGCGVRALVTALENSIINTLSSLGIDSNAKPDAPGVYVNGDKIASLGLRIKKGRSYHGMGLNVDMDLSPFLRINPCGYQGLEMTQISKFAPQVTIEQIKQRWVEAFCKELDYQFDGIEHER